MVNMALEKCGVKYLLIIIFLFVSRTCLAGPKESMAPNPAPKTPSTSIQKQQKKVTTSPKQKKTSPQIICDKFEIKTKVEKTDLFLSLETDLPDDTVVMVSVSRSYKEKGNTSTYSLNYFSEKSTADSRVKCDSRVQTKR
jgi:hypothetical protein